MATAWPKPLERPLSTKERSKQTGRAIFASQKTTLRTPIGRRPTFQIGGPPKYRRSAFLTSGALRHVCKRTGSVAVELCANSGRSARQGKPPTVATAYLCQRSNRQPRNAFQRASLSAALDYHSIQQEPGRAFVVPFRGTNPRTLGNGSRLPAENTTPLLPEQTSTDSRSPLPRFTHLPVGVATCTVPTSTAPGHHPRRRQVTPALVTHIIWRMTWVRTALRRSGPSQ